MLSTLMFHNGPVEIKHRKTAVINQTKVMQTGIVCKHGNELSKLPSRHLSRNFQSDTVVLLILTHCLSTLKYLSHGTSESQSALTVQ